MKKFVCVLVMCLLFLCLTTVVFAGGEKEEGAKTISFYSGSPGGGWYPIAVAISDVWTKNIEGLDFRHADAGGAGNLIAIDVGKADAAITTTASIGDGVKGNPPFETGTTKVKALAAFNPEYYTIWTWKNSGIENIEDLKGKRIVPLPKGYTTEVLTQKVLAAVGLTYDDMAKIDHVHLDEAVNLMKDGHTDAMANAFSFKGDPNMTELSIQRPVRALNITDAIANKVKEGNPGIATAMLPAGSYNGIDEDVQVLSFALALAVSADLSDELVYNMTKSLVENWEDVKLVSESFSGVDAKQFANESVGVEFHPGAAKYYKEQGWLK